MRSFTFWISMLLLPCLWCLACDDSGVGDADADGDVDGDGDSDVDADEDVAPDADEETPLVIAVSLRQRGQVTLEPGAGATVALGPEGAPERRELVTDGTGRATFDGVDWSQAPLAVTVHLDGWELRSKVGLTEAAVSAATAADGAYHVLLRYPRDLRHVTVTGRVANMSDEANLIFASATVAGEIQCAAGPEYSIEVVRDQPFTLVVAEAADFGTGSGDDFLTWAVLDHEAVTEPTTIDIDLSNSTPSTPFTGTLSPPEHGDSAFFDTASLLVIVRSRRSLNADIIGGLEERTRPDGRTWDYAGEYLALDADVIEAPLTQYTLSTTFGKSTVTLAGFPSAGAHDDLLFPEPPLVDPPSGGAYELDDTFTWSMNAVDLTDPELTVELRVAANTSTRFIEHAVDMPPGATEALIPSPPSSITPDDAYSDPRVGYLVSCDFEEDLHRCGRFAIAQEFPIN